MSKSRDAKWQTGPGWAGDSYGKDPYHFEHIPLRDAKSLKELKELIHVVETVNWTLHDRRTVHFNKYFAYGLPRALALAVEIELVSADVAEEVVAIRLADKNEVVEFGRASEG